MLQTHLKGGVNIGMNIGSVISFLEDLLEVLKYLSKSLDDLSPAVLGRALKFAVEIGGGLVIGGFTVLLLFVVVTKFGVRIFGHFVKHDTFPAVITTAIFVIPIVVAYVTPSPVSSFTEQD